ITDRLVGATNAMRVEAVPRRDGSGGGGDGAVAAPAVLRYAHKDLEECVGIATAAFATALLRGDVAPGVWFPEEAFAAPAPRRQLLEEATRGAFLWEREGG
ncbi:unnamed protein product, partial [Phaeothamnion confervicola]